MKRAFVLALALGAMPAQASASDWRFLGIDMADGEPVAVYFDAAAARPRTVDSRNLELAMVSVRGIRRSTWDLDCTSYRGTRIGTTVRMTRAFGAEPFFLETAYGICRGKARAIGRQVHRAPDADGARRLRAWRRRHGA